mmetsp:Transcript_165/g.469  ORF Transcript_165/g.469 Transcript_165/m.469 type:complete len:230 (+) Transcript_165:1433-2122(+)
MPRPAATRHPPSPECLAPSSSATATRPRARLHQHRHHHPRSHLRHQPLPAWPQHRCPQEQPPLPRLQRRHPPHRHARRCKACASEPMVVPSRTSPPRVGRRLEVTARARGRQREKERDGARCASLASSAGSPAPMPSNRPLEHRRNLRRSRQRRRQRWRSRRRQQRRRLRAAPPLVSTWKAWQLLGPAALCCTKSPSCTTSSPVFAPSVRRQAQRRQPCEGPWLDCASA